MISPALRIKLIRSLSSPVDVSGLRLSCRRAAGAFDLHARSVFAEELTAPGTYWFAQRSQAEAAAETLPVDGTEVRYFPLALTRVQTAVLNASGCTRGHHCIGISSGILNSSTVASAADTASAHGHADCSVALHRMAAQIADAAPSLLAAAKQQGNASVQYKLGWVLVQSAGPLGADFRRVHGKQAADPMTWFSLAAHQGHAAAQTILGLNYDNGGHEREAVDWYRRAAVQGYAPAQVNLGNMYRKGRGLPQSDAECMTWYRNAADQGYAPAMNAFGDMYRYGWGVSQNGTEAVKWYRKAARHGHAMAYHQLGDMYSRGRGVEPDAAEAVRWYRQAADHGVSAAHYNLGLMLLSGQAVARDDPEAFKWLRCVAERGNPNAQEQIGSMYAEGRGVAKDENEGAAWIQRAAQLRLHP